MSSDLASSLPALSLAMSVLVLKPMTKFSFTLNYLNMYLKIIIKC